MKKFTKVLTILFLSLGLVFSLLACNKPGGGPNNGEEETYSIVLPNVENGTVTASATSVKKGESVELTVTPAQHYELEFLKANDVELTVSNNKATISDITENQTITASFVGVDVVVTFVADGNTVESKTLKYGQAYGTLPTPNSNSGYEFAGWYTGENGAGSLVEEGTKVSTGEAHSLYAYFTAIPLEVVVEGMVDKLVHLPGSDSEIATLSVKVLADNNEITSDVEVKLETSDSSLVTVNGLNLSVAENADGEAIVRVLVDSVEYKRFTVQATDYVGLGYEAVNTKEEFMSMQGTGKYILMSDIDVNGWLSKSDYTPLISKLEAGAVIDGNGHVVKNAKLPGGWNKCWISEVEGTVRNIAFVNLRNADSNAYSTGLFGFLKTSGVLENIYVDANIPTDGSIDSANHSGGVLIGTLEGGTIRNVVLNVNVQKDVKVEAYGAFAAIITSKDAKVYNSYAIINHSYLREFGNELLSLPTQ